MVQFFHFRPVAELGGAQRSETQVFNDHDLRDGYRAFERGLTQDSYRLAVAKVRGCNSHN